VEVDSSILKQALQRVLAATTAAVFLAIATINCERIFLQLQINAAQPSMDLAACGMIIRDTLHVTGTFCMQWHYFCPYNLKLAMCWDPSELYVWANLILEFVETLVARDLVEPVCLMERPESRALYLYI